MNTTETLREVTSALGDLSFECFGVIGHCIAPSVATYNRTFAVLEKARAFLAQAETAQPAPSSPLRMLTEQEAMDAYALPGVDQDSPRWIHRINAVLRAFAAANNLKLKD